MQNIKSTSGNFFEDFSIGQTLIHGVPRTITESDGTLYLALTGSRFALHCAKTVAAQVGFSSTPLDNFLVFHIAFGKTVNDISLNAVANLGYAELCFHRASFSGDTLSVSSKVIGLKENSNGKTGIVYVHSKAVNQNQELILDWKRWVMIKMRDSNTPSDINQVPELQSAVLPSSIKLDSRYDFSNWQPSYSDNQKRFDDFDIGEVINHRAGITINDTDHSLATRLYQNNARVHFDQALMDNTVAQKRLVYGGHIISLCRALSYNGLGNAIWLSAINGGSHSNPSYAGDTIYSQSRILDKQTIEGRDDLGLVRVQMIGTKNTPSEQIDQLFERVGSRLKYDSAVVLDLDYSVLMLK